MLVINFYDSNGYRIEKLCPSEYIKNYGQFVLWNMPKNIKSGENFI